MLTNSSRAENLLPSGDECDVIFGYHPKGAIVIEIKNGNRGELEKGIFQAIKYRALMEAEKGQGKLYPVKAFLVAYKIYDDIQRYAQKFNITCIEISDKNISTDNRTTERRF